MKKINDNLYTIINNISAMYFDDSKKVGKLYLDNGGIYTITENDYNELLSNEDKFIDVTNGLYVVAANIAILKKNEYTETYVLCLEGGGELNINENQYNAIKEIEDSGSGGGTEVIANPEIPEGAEDLSALSVDGTVYKIPEGGGGSTSEDIVIRFNLIFGSEGGDPEVELISPVDYKEIYNKLLQNPHANIIAKFENATNEGFVSIPSFYYSETNENGTYFYNSFILDKKYIPYLHQPSINKSYEVEFDFYPDDTEVCTLNMYVMPLQEEEGGDSSFSPSYMVGAVGYSGVKSYIVDMGGLHYDDQGLLKSLAALMETQADTNFRVGIGIIDTNSSDMLCIDYMMLKEVKAKESSDYGDIVCATFIGEYVSVYLEYSVRNNAVIYNKFYDIRPCHHFVRLQGAVGVYSFGGQGIFDFGFEVTTRGPVLVKTGDGSIVENGGYTIANFESIALNMGLRDGDSYVRLVTSGKILNNTDNTTTPIIGCTVGNSEISIEGTAFSNASIEATSSASITDNIRFDPIPKFGNDSYVK